MRRRKQEEGVTEYPCGCRHDATHWLHLCGPEDGAKNQGHQAEHVVIHERAKRDKKESDDKTATNPGEDRRT